MWLRAGSLTCSVPHLCTPGQSFGAVVGHGQHKPGGSNEATSFSLTYGD